MTKGKLSKLIILIGISILLLIISTQYWIPLALSAQSTLLNIIGFALILATIIFCIYSGSYIYKTFNKNKTKEKKDEEI